ncbi:Stealth CR1 domain-containing protein [Porphyromonadaceae bacterium W3.11]|nr:Stealth CR1 domain-containing protein [Porphyromonadaceae bacterium W3.11]
MKIDFVVTWVDMDDPRWKKEFAQYSGKIDNSKNEVSEARFRDYGLLKYWFRGIETFAPWVNKIHFVTCGQKPEWLNVDNPKLNMVDHKDFIPEEYLPVFNSNLIEIYMHRIPGLSEHFVYFNDDFFVINDVTEDRFFQNGLPCDIAAFRTNTGLSQYERMLKNNIRLINRFFDKKEVMKRDHDKWFAPFYGKRKRLNHLLKHYNKFITLRTPHNAQPFLKSTFEEVWAHCEKELIDMSSHRFRSDDDYTPELFRTWQICTSNFTPYNTYQDTKMFPLVLKSEKAIKAIRDQSYRLICINDNVHVKDYDKTLGRIKESFHSILPQKSSFEL